MNQYNGWTFVLLSSLLTILGALTVYLDSIYNALTPKWLSKRYPLQITGNNNFLTCSLALSSGCLMFTSMFKLLPSSLEYFQQYFKDSELFALRYTLLFYVLGMLFCGILNMIIHFLTSDSIVHCVHDTEANDPVDDHGAHDHHNNHSHDHNSEHHEHQHRPMEMLSSRKSLVDIALSKIKDQPLDGNCHGYTTVDQCKSAELEPLLSNSSANNSPIYSQTGHDMENSDVFSNYEEHHHHHVNTPTSKLLSIGVQTLLAITLHKFPEGFILYSTSKVNPELGVAIFLSMFIHNYIEGMSMCLPLFFALDSRLKAVSIVSLVGGLAQPLGAYLGYLYFQTHTINNRTNFVFAVLIAATSGFLTIIGLQMFASSLSFGGSQFKVLTCCTTGIALISLGYTMI
ncbi:Zinc transporter [Komagataella phaffii CBS 7435]|uniref:Vacuolar membrane zinc transporter n=2 Tax=Komagataella phaffii TaxID=460519 RepID=C4R642_KOMPG|nr:Vacuolar membrane zinc transporter [Komagataella phaffii GS115]AOA63178.1 GQ67_04095T0 [Komagataella phaffii]CAH2449150.1 Zinc transporter [Komagataella phaffii CBS 7435]AOA68455.1 GQ68_04068T0 [Komagataella phaffii GS115]CAY71028.1 Vacuolar membrane zinc transporter [Komagataella phaffii GS115]CCA39176.1 Zinc transporter [Komagataella phaffii CBS 7435]